MEQQHQQQHQQQQQQPAILFDLNYNDQMNETECKSLARQLTLSYAANKRATHPFKFFFGGSFSPTYPNPNPDSLFSIMKAQKMDSWPSVTTIDSKTPWDHFDPSSSNIIYLTADSKNTLSPSTFTNHDVYIIGGLVDHTDKSGSSYHRATTFNFTTARFPLQETITMSSPRTADRHKTDFIDISTLACVQLLHNSRKFLNFPEAIYNTPAFHSAPLRKFIRWNSPYDFLNNEQGRPHRLGKDFSLTPSNFVPPSREVIEKIKVIGKIKTKKEFLVYLSG